MPFNVHMTRYSQVEEDLQQMKMHEPGRQGLLRDAQPLAVEEACKAVLCLTSGLKRVFDSFGISVRGDFDFCVPGILPMKESR